MYRFAGLTFIFDSYPSPLFTIFVIHGISFSSEYKSYSSAIGSKAFMTEEAKKAKSKSGGRRRGEKSVEENNKVSLGGMDGHWGRRIRKL